jgi:hypothetical protein
VSCFSALLFLLFSVHTDGLPHNSWILASHSTFLVIDALQAISNVPAVLLECFFEVCISLRAVSEVRRVLSPPRLSSNSRTLLTCRQLVSTSLSCKRTFTLPHRLPLQPFPPPLPPPFLHSRPPSRISSASLRSPSPYSPPPSSRSSSLPLSKTASSSPPSSPYRERAARFASKMETWHGSAECLSSYARWR